MAAYGLSGLPVVLPGHFVVFHDPALIDDKDTVGILAQL